MQQEFISFVGAKTSPLKHSPQAKKVVEVKFFNQRQNVWWISFRWSHGMRSVREESTMGGKQED